MGEGTDTGETQLRLFAQSDFNNLLSLWRDKRIFFSQGREFGEPLLADNLVERTFVGAGAAEPFVDNDAKGILIAGHMGLTIDLLWGHVAGTASDILQDQAFCIGIL